MDPTIRRRDFLRGSAMLAAGSVAAGALAPPAALAQAPTAALKPVRIVNAGGSTSLALQELINRQGYLKEFGVTAEFTDVADTAKIIASVVSGDQDICMFAGFGQALPAIEKGARLKVLGGAWMLAPVSLFSVKPDVRKLEDLAGRTVGTGSIGSVLHVVVVALLQKRGIDPAKVNFVNVGTTTDILKAVAAGTVDAGTVNVDAYEQKDKLGIHPIVDLWKELPEFPFQGSFASDNAIKDKRDALVRTLAAHARLYRFISAPGSKDAYVSAYVAANNGSADAGAKQWQFIQDSQCYAVNLVIPQKSIRTMQDLNVQMKMQKAVLPNDQVADMSLAEDALKLLKG
jgi:ABC-type nitrate/sulfonate/bicarbonate transport system substrate-binding protein